MDSHGMQFRHTETHVGSTATIHIRRLDIGCGQAEVSELDHDLTLRPPIGERGPAVRNNEVLGLDVPVDDLLIAEIAEREELLQYRQYGIPLIAEEARTISAHIRRTSSLLSGMVCNTRRV